MEITGSEIIIEILAEQGIDTVFGYPGGNVLSIYDKLSQNRHGIRHILTAHEQGAVHACDGYSRSGKGIGVVIATSGPGATNLITGLATAFADSVPIVAITGSVPVSSIGTDSFQEIDTASLTLAATKHSSFIKDIQKLAPTLRKAFEIAKSGRPGPVLVDIPHDIQKAYCSFDTSKGCSHKTPADCDASQDTASLDMAVSLINRCHRPVVYCGGGVINGKCSEEIQSLAEKCGAYMAFTMMGLSAASASHPRYLGMAGLYGRMEAAKAISEADLIIAAGVRFSDRGTGNREKFGQNARIIHLDIDQAEQGKVINADIEITGSLKEALSYITENIEEASHPEWDIAVEKIKTDYSEKRGGKTDFSPRNIIETVNSMTSEGVPVATDVGQHQMWVSKYYDFRRPGTHLTSGGFGTMGYGMGAAIGAALSVNGKSVLFTGDGSFCMNFNEVTTAVRYSVPVIVIVLNNGGLGMIRQLQDCFCDGRRFSTELMRKTDFAQFAKAVGAEGYRAESLEELKDAYRNALKAHGPVVIDCCIKESENALPMIPPNGTIDEIIRQGE